MPYPKGVKEGDTLVAVGEVEDNIGGKYPDGTEFLVARLDIDFLADENALNLAPLNDGLYETILWFYFGDWASEEGMLDNHFRIKE